VGDPLGAAHGDMSRCVLIGQSTTCHPAVDARYSMPKFIHTSDYRYAEVTDHFWWSVVNKWGSQYRAGIDHGLDHERS